MTDLSPVAQAVLNAVEDQDEFRYRLLAAAALSAAANQMAAWSDENGRIDLDDLYEIAAELEGAGG